MSRLVSRMSNQPEKGRDGVEIERKYLLDGVPEIPATAMAFSLEQGYLPGEPDDRTSGAEDDAKPGQFAGDSSVGRQATGNPMASIPEGGGRCAEGRLRKAIGPDGVAVMTHTIKTGRGVVRTEIEREITAAEFEAHWPLTLGCRIKKTRYRVAGEGLSDPIIWEIDVFEDRALVLAEVELPCVDAEVVFPRWLAGHIVREVTDEAGYTNHALAAGVPPG